MTLLELGHWSTQRPDADGVARALCAHASCISVRILPPEGDRDGWSVAATYEDPPAPRLFPPAARTGGRR
jgi:hypothetical protein